ncbi:acyl-CoA dehydrogenase family protein [Euzebya sp.]|uniref:acyl-CoA dehydrogenase family protein n=1 Tax=Euzebya sp. TaxID=1971409 RepID=UPI003513EE26
MILPELDADRRALREVVDQFLAEASSSEVVHRVVDGGGAAALDRAVAEMGWVGIDVPESLGGGGAGLSELAVVLRGCGAASASTRLLGTGVLCVGALLAAGSDDQRERWVPPLVDGSLAGAVAMPGVFSSGERVAAQETGEGWVLDGTASFVVDLVGADVVVVRAVSSSAGAVLAVVQTAADGVSVVHQPTVDRTRSLGRLALDGVAVGPDAVLAVGSTADTAIEALVDRVAVAMAADAVGITSRVLEMTTTYTRQREQFGRPIGSFQAVKHQAADVLVGLEGARVLLDQAAVEVGAGAATASRTASMAKDLACGVAARAAGTAIQLHGGIGYTWEHDLHIHLKRAKLDEALFGDGRWHRSRVVGLLGDGGLIG